MILRETDEYLLIRVTEPLARALEARRIFRKENSGAIACGEDAPCAFDKCAVLEPYTNFLRRGPFVAMGAFSYTYSHMPLGIRVGRYCSISWGLRVLGFQHPVDRLSTSPFVYGPGIEPFASALTDARLASFPAIGASQKPSPVIKDDVWIGQNVTLANGITLGTGCIVAGESIVTKSVEPYAIVGGNPARMIRRRFSDDICDRLLASQWWRYSFTDFGKWTVRDPEAFLDAFGSADLAPFTPETLGWQAMAKLCHGVNAAEHSQVPPPTE